MLQNQATSALTELLDRWFLMLNFTVKLIIFKQEGVGDTLQELWISYNFIEKMKGVNVLKKLKVLYISNNLVKDWSEYNKLQELPVLEDLLFVGRLLNKSKFNFNGLD